MLPLPCEWPIELYEFGVMGISTHQDLMAVTLGLLVVTVLIKQGNCGYPPDMMLVALDKLNTKFEFPFDVFNYSETIERLDKLMTILEPGI